LVHQAPAKEKLPAGDDAWWLFSPESGKQAAKFPFEEGTGCVSVAGPRAF
jgi:hypothetical protein